MFVLCLFFFKQKTAYEMRISDWSSDVCSSDLPRRLPRRADAHPQRLWREVGAAQEGEGQPDRRGYARRADRDRLGQAARPQVQLADQGQARVEIGRASCRERVCQYV